MQPKGKLSLQGFVHFNLSFWANTEDSSAQYLMFFCKLILSLFIATGFDYKSHPPVNENSWQSQKMFGGALSVPYNSKWELVSNRIPLHLLHCHWYNP